MHVPAGLPVETSSTQIGRAVKNTSQDNHNVSGPLRRLLSGFDCAQFAAVACLLGVGVVFIRSIGVEADTELTAGLHWRQLQWIAIGFCFYFALALTDYRHLLIPSVGFYLACLLLLILVLSVGTTVFGARRWISVPGIGMRLQPSEMTKLAVVMVLSALLSSRVFAIDDEGERGGRRRPGQMLGLAVAALVVIVPFLLIVRQPDLGSALILPPIGAAITFAAGLRWKILAWASGIMLLLFTLIVLNDFLPSRHVDEQGQEVVTYGVYPLLRGYQKERLLTFLDPERDLAHRGYNQFQAKLAVGSGGLTGKGIGQSTQNMLGFLPQSVSNNDFIFSVIAEETGFLGCLTLLGLYLLLFYSIIRTAVTTADSFGRYLCIGVGTMMFTHVYVNIGMSIGLSPVTGLPLPFVSYGGSFILTGMAATGMLQSVYRHRNEET